MYIKHKLTLEIINRLYNLILNVLKHTYLQYHRYKIIQMILKSTFQELIANMLTSLVCIDHHNLIYFSFMSFKENKKIVYSSIYTVHCLKCIMRTLNTLYFILFSNCGEGKNDCNFSRFTRGVAFKRYPCREDNVDTKTLYR